MRVDWQNEEYPAGFEFDVGGILFVNGDTVEVSDEELELFEAKNGESLKSALSRVQFSAVDGQKSYSPPEVEQPAEQPLEYATVEESETEKVGDN